MSIFTFDYSKRFPRFVRNPSSRTRDFKQVLSMTSQLVENRFGGLFSGGSGHVEMASDLSFTEHDVTNVSR